MSEIEKHIGNYSRGPQDIGPVPASENVNEIRKRLMNRMTSGWIVLHPHGKANPTKNYRVAQFSDWLDFANGETTGCLFQTEHPTYDEAAASRDKLNGADK